MLPIPDAAWFAVRGLPRGGCRFPSSVKNRYRPAGKGRTTGRSVSEVLGDAIRCVGLKHKPRDLRAATAREMNRKKVSVCIIQRGARNELMETMSSCLPADVVQVWRAWKHCQLPVVGTSERSGRRRAA